METEEIKKLIKEALLARDNSYCPYSGYAVGAALLTAEGKIYRGCNIENSSFGATNCAERTAIFKAVSEGCRKLKAIAICGAPKGEPPRDFAYPCGICRQVMSEFAESDFTIIVAIGEDEYKLFTMQDILPASFCADSMK